MIDDGTKDGYNLLALAIIKQAVKDLKTCNVRSYNYRTAYTFLMSEDVAQICYIYGINSVVVREMVIKQARGRKHKLTVQDAAF